MLITIEEKPRRNRGLCLQSEKRAEALFCRSVYTGKSLRLSSTAQEMASLKVGWALMA